MAADKSPIDEAPFYGKHEQEDLGTIAYSARAPSSVRNMLPPAAGGFTKPSASTPATSWTAACASIANLPSQGRWLSLALFTKPYASTPATSWTTACTSIAELPDIGHLTFSGYGLTAIGLIIFVILLGDNLDKLLPGTVVEILGYQVHGKQLFVLAAATVILPMTWLKNLSVLAYLGGRAGLVGCVEQVLLISSVMCSLNYTVTTVLGYLSYGEDVQVKVTLNLPTGKLYTKIAILTTLITPLAKYALVIQPITMAIEDKLSAMMAAVADNRNNGLTRVLTSSRRCQHDGAGVHFALLRQPHVVHRVLAERRHCHVVPVPELPQDLHAPRRSCPLRRGSDCWDTGHWSVRHHRWHLHFPSPDYRHILIGHPTSLHDRGRDSDDDDFRDRDYDVAALANNLSQAFRYVIYNNDDMEECRIKGHLNGMMRYI
uniref:Amino acid transporter transmembrane domain-containing protein n=1 Tax=Oryza nivara TaxID=4536 RepID=A0A0E0FNP7_ORYNI